MIPTTSSSSSTRRKPKAKPAKAPRSPSSEATPTALERAHAGGSVFEREAPPPRLVTVIVADRTQVNVAGQVHDAGAEVEVDEDTASLWIRAGYVVAPS